jgi:hypothetical protein
MPVEGLDHIQSILRVVGEYTNSVTGDSNAFLSSVNLESLNSNRRDFVSPPSMTSFSWVLNESLARKSEVLGHSR